MVDYESSIVKGGADVWWKKSDTSLDLSSIDDPREVEIELTDTDTFEIFKARAKICSDKSKLSEPNLLKLFDHESMGGTKKDPVATVYVQIIERLEEPEIKVTFHREKQRFAQMKGEVLKSLLSEDKKKH